MKRRNFIVAIAGVAIWSGAYLTIYTVAQQILRQGANDPQIQMAEDAANSLASGDTPDSITLGALVDPAKSLAPFWGTYDETGKLGESSGIIDGDHAQPPAGVFAYARAHGEDRITWETKSGIRMATVIVYAGGKFNGFVLWARSLAEVERRESAIAQMCLIAWLATLALGAIIYWALV